MLICIPYLENYLISMDEPSEDDYLTNTNSIMQIDDDICNDEPCDKEAFIQVKQGSSGSNTDDCRYKLRAKDGYEVTMSKALFDPLKDLLFTFIEEENADYIKLSLTKEQLDKFVNSLVELYALIHRPESNLLIEDICKYITKKIKGLEKEQDVNDRTLFYILIKAIVKYHATIPLNKPNFNLVLKDSSEKRKLLGNLIFSLTLLLNITQTYPICIKDREPLACTALASTSLLELIFIVLFLHYFLSNIYRYIFKKSASCTKTTVTKNINIKGKGKSLLQE